MRNNIFFFSLLEHSVDNHKKSSLWQSEGRTCGQVIYKGRFPPIKNKGQNLNRVPAIDIVAKFAFWLNYGY